MQGGKADLFEKTRAITKLLRERYSAIPLDDTERMMANFERFLQRSCSRTISTQSFLEDAAMTISRTTGLAEVVVLHKDRSDGKYRYVAFVGVRGEAISAYKKIAYTYDEIMSSTESEFHCIEVDDITEFYLGEFTPPKEEEIDTYNRPSLLSMERTADDEFREGDYIEIYMNGSGNDVLGCFELSRTRDGKLPSRQTIKWLELMVSVVGLLLYEREYSGARH
jgi:hypothetical protein